MTHLTTCPSRHLVVHDTLLISIRSETFLKQLSVTSFKYDSSIAYQEIILFVCFCLFDLTLEGYSRSERPLTTVCQI